MKITVNLRGNTLIATLSGELDHHTAKKVKDTVEEVIRNKGVMNLIFDLSSLSFMDSSGIGVVVGRYKLIKSIGGKVAIVSTSSHVDRLLTMSGIKRIIDVFKTPDDAINKIEEEIS